MKHIDLGPAEHSHLYELRPMSRWWLAVVIALVILEAWINGFTNWVTWALVFFGWALGLAMVLVFPRYWLSKIIDHRD